MRWWRVAMLTLLAAGIVATALHMSYRVERKPVTELPAPAPLRMESITLERTPCFGSCPVYTVTVHRNGDVVFRATRFLHEENGITGASHLEWRTRVPDASLHALVAAVESVEYARLEPRYSIPVTDFPRSILTVQGGGKTHSTSVYAVPCRSEARVGPIEQFPEVQSVPDVFCRVEALVDVASCARYWAYYSTTLNAMRGPNRYPLPPRCNPST